MRTALRVLAISLNRIRDISQAIDNEGQNALKKQTILARHETIQCAAVVILSGYFESCLKDIVERCSVEISRRGRPFQALPAVLRKHHYKKGGEILALRASGANKGAWITASEADIAARLHSTASSQRYELLWEAFADTRSNPTLDVVVAIAASFGVQEPGNQIAQSMNTRFFSLNGRVRSFIDVRNECAHTGTASNVPTTTTIREYCDLIEALCTGLVDVLEKHLSQPPFGLNLNLASIPELACLPGLGPQRAAVIFSYRRTNGPFTSVTELLSVKGIARATYDRVKCWLCV